MNPRAAPMISRQPSSLKPIATINEKVFETIGSTQPPIRASVPLRVCRRHPPQTELERQLRERDMKFGYRPQPKTFGLSIVVHHLGNQSSDSWHML